MLKRYIVFAFAEYRARGGWEDVMNDGVDENGMFLVRSFDTVEEAKAVADAEKIFDCTEVVDLHTGQIVA